MIGQRKQCLLLSLAVLASLCTGRANAQATSSSNESLKPFLGRWDLTVRMPQREGPSWIEVSEKEGQPAVEIVGLFGNANPADKVEVADGELKFLAPKDEGFDNAQFTAMRAGSRLEGTATPPNGAAIHWTGRRAPSLKKTGSPNWGSPIKLFNGKNLNGWRFSNPEKGAVWSVEKGELVKYGSGAEIITNSKFEDFKLHVEFNCGPMANSGVYLRGRYEVQIETDSASDPPNRRMGAIYGFIAPDPELPRTPGVWQTYDITLVGRTVTVVHDGKTVIDQKEIPGITGGALDSNEGSPGPIYLQGSEAGRVAFRNIVITPAE